MPFRQRWQHCVCVAWNRLTVRRSCLALQPDKAFDPEIMKPIQIVIGVAKSDPVFRGIVAGYVEQQEQQVALEHDLQTPLSPVCARTHAKERA